MRQDQLWNRREFVQWMGATSLGAISPGATWPLVDRELQRENIPAFAYVGYGEPSEQQGIQVFAIRRERWTAIQTLASQNPTFLTLHPNQRFLYVANEIDVYQGLPSGTVEAYAIAPEDGRLTLLNREPLSLSATKPKHLAVSPDGHNLIVAASGGGAYNVLPIQADGRLGSVTGIIKEVGAGPHQQYQQASHPQMVMFDPTGRNLLCTDLGSDRVNLFKWDDDTLTQGARTSLRPGSGPRQMVLHPAGKLLYIRNELAGSISCYGYTCESGRILQPLHDKPASRHGAGLARASALAIHPSGRYLYNSENHAADGHVQMWRIDAATGALTKMDSHLEDLGTASQIVMNPSGSVMLALSHNRGVIFSMDIDHSSCLPGSPVAVAQLPSPLCIDVKFS